MNKLKNIKVSVETSIKEALKIIDTGASQIAIVVDKDDTFLGTITDGDIRRAILKGDSLDHSIFQVYNKTPKYVKKNDSKSVIKELMTKYRIDKIPVIDDNNRVVSIVEWEDILDESVDFREYIKIDVPVVIMAGGKGTRMEPFTQILPKPLIPIGEKPILDVIIDGFKKYKVNDFYITINYKGNMIEAYYKNEEFDHNMNFVWEEDFYGTAGALLYAKDDLIKTFIVSNCDIIVKADYADVLDFHKKSGSLLTVISSIQHHKIPYGVINFEDGGRVTGLIEKPEYTFAVNTGVYILEPKCLEYIKEGEIFHMTHLMEALIEDGETVSTYPVKERDYIDIGQWQEYRDAVKIMRTDD